MLIVCKPLFDSWVGKIRWEGLGHPLQNSWASLVAQLLKNLACNVGDLGSTPGLGRSPGEGNILCRREWFTHWSILAWRIPWTVYSMGSMVSERVVQDWVTFTFTFFLHFFHSTSCFGVCSSISQWHPTPVLLPGKSHGWRRLIGCSPWGR